MNKLYVDDMKQLLDALLPFYKCIDEKTNNGSTPSKLCFYNIHSKLQKKKNKIKKLKKKLKQYKKLLKNTKKTNGIVLEINEKDEKDSIQNMLDVKFDDKTNIKKQPIIISDDDESCPDENLMTEHEETEDDTDDDDLQESKLNISPENNQKKEETKNEENEEKEKYKVFAYHGEWNKDSLSWDTSTKVEECFDDEDEAIKFYDSLDVSKDETGDEFYNYVGKELYLDEDSDGSPLKADWLEVEEEEDEEEEDEEGEEEGEEVEENKEDVKENKEDVKEEEVEEEEVEEDEDEEEEDEEEVFEYNIDNKTYYVTNKLNSAIYELLEDGDVGDEVGKIINGQVKWD